MMFRSKLSLILSLLIFGFTCITFKKKDTGETLKGQTVVVYGANDSWIMQKINVNGEIWLDLTPLSSYDLDVQLHYGKEYHSNNYVSYKCHIPWYSMYETIYVGDEYFKQEE